MRVALLSRSAHPLHDPGGMERAIYLLAKHLQARGVDTVLVTRPATHAGTFPGRVVTVPYGTFHDVVRSFEWTRLEPGVVSVKLYARGLGIIREQDVAGGNERFDLVAVSHG